MGGKNSTLSDIISTGRHFQNGHHNTANIQHCPISSKFDMWVDNDVPNWFPTLKNFYQSPFSKWPPQYCTNSTLSDFNAISYVGRLWCPELIVTSKNFYRSPFLVHLDQRSRWTIAITWRPSSVVCRLSSVNFSHFKFFVPVGYSIWLPRPIICFDWLKFQRSSSLKLMNWLNPNCTGMIIGMSLYNLKVFCSDMKFKKSIGNPRWPPPQYID